MKVLVGAFNREKALVGAFSVIVKSLEPSDNLRFKLNCYCNEGAGILTMACMVQVTTLASSPSSHQFITAGHDRMLHMWDILSR